MQQMEDFETIEGKQYPIVYVTRDKKTGYCKFWCKYCHKWHRHGVGDGHRCAHCTDNTSPYMHTGYILKTKDSAFGYLGSTTYIINLFDFSNNERKSVIIFRDSSFDKDEEILAKQFLDEYEEGNYSSATLTALTLMKLIQEGDVLTNHESEGNGFPDYEIERKGITETENGEIKVLWHSELKNYEGKSKIQDKYFFVEFKSHLDSLRLNQLYECARIAKYEAKVYCLHIDKKEGKYG